MNFQSKGSKLCLQRQTPLATQRRTRTMTKTIRFTGLAHLNQEDESYSTRDSSTSLHLSTSLNPCPHHHQQHEKIKNTLKIYKGPARNAHSLFQSSSFLQKHASHYTEIDWIKTPMVDCALLNHSKYFTSVNEFRNYLYDENMSCVIPMYKPRGVSSQSFIIEFKKKFDLDKRMRIGHSGSLDPSAYGLLILGVNGQGTKALNYIPDSNCKDYEFVIQCGSCTPSYDSDTIQFANHCSNYKYFFDKNCQSIEQVNEKIQKYLNERNYHLIQTTPVFSAVKKGGKRLATYGHQTLERMKRMMMMNDDSMNGSSILTNQEPQGHDLQPQVYTHSTNTTSSSSIPQSFTNTSSSSVNTRVFDSSMILDHDLYYYKGMYSEEDDIPKRRIRIDRLECIGMDREKGQLSFSCTCSTGTYIRVLGYEIGHLLEVCGAYVVELYRSRIGPLSTMLRLEDLGNE